MLKETDEKIKFRVLVRRLSKFGETRRSVIGLLELLWKHTAIDAPQGDVGRFTDEEIAAVLEFDGPPEELVESLVVSGWLDRCDRHRLVVHDWHEHAPRWVASKLSREGREFAKSCAGKSAVATTVASAVPSALGESESAVASAVQTPSIAYSSLAHSSKSHPVQSSAVASCSEPSSTPDSKRVRKSKLEGFDRFYEAYPRKVSRGDAEKAWVKIPVHEREQVIEAAREFRDAKAGSDLNYVPYPATWLNGRRWLDDRSTWRTQVTTPCHAAGTFDLSSPDVRLATIQGMLEIDERQRENANKGQAR